MKRASDALIPPFTSLSRIRIAPFGRIVSSTACLPLIAAGSIAAVKNVGSGGLGGAGAGRRAGACGPASSSATRSDTTPHYTGDVPAGR